MGLLIWKSYKKIDWRIAKSMTISMIPGTIIGTLLLSKAGLTFLQLFLAVSILVFLAKMIWFNGFTIGKKTTPAVATTTGLVSGLFQGLIGTGGPVLTMYLSVVIKQKEVIRATLIYIFFVTSLVRVGISIPQDLFTTHILHLALITLPFFLVAIMFGQQIHTKISDRYYRFSIYVVLGGSALALLIKAL
jgi:uncharacterized membrane protein YfcA